jgi:hypothetical protein
VLDHLHTQTRFRYSAARAEAPREPLPTIDVSPGSANPSTPARGTE